MIVWGGLAKTGSAQREVSTGGHYDPTSDSWRPTALLRAPSARSAHVALWTEGGMIIWGGDPSPYTGAATHGAIYMPDTATPIPAPSPTPTPATLLVSGRVAENDNGVGGVTVMLSGDATATAQTDASGNYSFDGLAHGGTYTVTPALDGYTFTPPSQTLTPMSTNGSADFAATPAASTRINYALSSNGGVATASSSYSQNYPASSINNGDRRGLNWNAGGGWNDATAGSHPDWVEVAFSGEKSISEVDIFTLQDNPTSPSEPTEEMAFTKYGLTGFEVRYWNGSAWAVVPGGAATGNDRVWRKFTFQAVNTFKIRVVVTGSLASYSRLVEVEAWGTGGGVPTPVGRTNVALASKGGAVTASSSYDTNYPASALNNGDRRGLNWNAGGGWNDATGGTFPDWVEVSFDGQKSIEEIDVFTLQDNPAAPSEPTEAQTFTKYGITDFEVQYWNGASWVKVAGGSITGNNLVRRKLTFPAVTTSKIRVLIRGALAGYSRITEIEAY
jgi:hypothetical protein